MLKMPRDRTGCAGHLTAALVVHFDLKRRIDPMPYLCQTYDHMPEGPDMSPFTNVPSFRDTDTPLDVTKSTGGNGGT